MLKLLNQLQLKLQNGDQCCLVTLIHVDGSSFRRPGSRMLVVNGQALGAVSGGCLEADIVDQSEASGHVQMLYYDTSTEHDLVWGTASGCGGKISVLIEPVSVMPSYLVEIKEAIEQRKNRLQITWLRVQASDSQLLFIRRYNEHNIDSFKQELRNKKEVKGFVRQYHELANRKSACFQYTLSDQAIDYVLMENISPPVLLVLFGAGNDAQAISPLAKRLGWQIIVYDPSKNKANKQRFPDADKIIVAEFDNIHRHLSFDEKTCALLMTHRFDYDKLILSALAECNIGYLGLLGSHQRCAKLINSQETNQQKIQVYAPAGLDIGSETPEEIALSILAEITAKLNARKGGSLRETPAYIHNR